MKEAKRRRLIDNKQLEDVPELVQYVQSLLPADVAARTCLVSKSWLHAFSTTPTLRFHRSVRSLNKQQERKYTRLINRTLRRYHRDNLPVMTFDLHYGIRKQKSAARAEKWIKCVASKSSLKELCITIFDDIGSFTFPDEILSSENLNTLSLKLEINSPQNYSLHFSSNHVMRCVKLRVLELLDVHISEEVLHDLLSTCKLLEKINLKFPKGMKKIKVHDLCYLHELKIAPNYVNNILEISNVPRLRSLSYDAYMICIRPVSFQMDLIGSLRDLYLNFVDVDDAFSDMIKYKFPFLESLTLIVRRCRVEKLDIRCVSLQKLNIQLWEEKQIEVEVYAPKLRFFEYTGLIMPTLVYPTVAPEQIKLTLILRTPIDHLFFLKMRETLELSSNFNIHVKFSIDKRRFGGSGILLPFNIDDVRTSVQYPATNVEKLSLEMLAKEGLWENSLLFDEVCDAVFAICHPKYVGTHL